MTKNDDRVEMLNVNSPGHVVRVERAKYEAMRDAMLAVVPAEARGQMARADTKPLRFYRP